MYSILRKILFLFDAELIHEFSVHSIKTFNKIPLIDILIKKCFCINDKRLERNILGLKFKRILKTHLTNIFINNINIITLLKN